LRRGIGDPAAQRARVGDIDNPAMCLAPLAGECGNRFIDARLTARAQGQVAAFLGQKLTDRAPDPARAAGDDRLLTIQPKIQFPLPGRPPIIL
jgi:hypothetical protein